MAVQGDAHGPVAGRDQYIQQSLRDPLIDLDWWDHPEAPSWELDPGIEQVAGDKSAKLLVTFYWDRRGAGTPRVRWNGPGIEMEFIEPMRQNTPPRAQREKFQCKPATAALDDLDEAEVEFEIDFVWVDGQRHGARWRWPLERHANGNWKLNTHRDNMTAPADRW